MDGYPVATVAVMPGFDDPVAGSQRVFRVLLAAFAHPATLRDVPRCCDHPAVLEPATAAVCLTLLDYETPLWVDPRLETAGVREFVRFHCGSPLVTTPRTARFALLDCAAGLRRFDEFDCGDIEYPERSTTLLIQCRGFAAAAATTFSGPGIRDRAQLAVTGIEFGFREQWRKNHQLFPRGVDIIFIHGSRIAALPRTTQVET
jgi:alpha-D-ribose 1-methylphosphonate 5-triphosphate synthase subunit PhnH